MPDESIQVRLPDGSPVEVPRGSSAADIAAGIGPGLARAALAAVVDDEVVDLARPVSPGAEVRILTSRDDDALPVLRHSAAHVLATAVRELHPTAGIGFGPPIEDGFYYDFEVDEPFTPEDLEAFEARMRDIVAADLSLRAAPRQQGGGQGALRRRSPEARAPGGT